MTAHRPDRGAPLVIDDSDPDGLTFHTDGPPAYVGETHLDTARLRCAKWGFDYIGRNSVDESDVTELHNELRAARARYALLDGCRRAGCENRTDAPDLLCTVHRAVADDVSARIRRTA